MSTIASVNRALKKAGIDAELVKGKGYFWFDGDEASGFYSNSVSVFRVNQLTDDQWVKEYHTLKEDSLRRKGLSASTLITADSNPEDLVTVDLPLLLRLLELSREDLKTDIQLHVLTEDIARVARNLPPGKPLRVSDYEDLSRRALATTLVTAATKGNQMITNKTPLTADKFDRNATISSDKLALGPHEMDAYRKGAFFVFPSVKFPGSDAIPKQVLGFYVHFDRDGKSWWGHQDADKMVAKITKLKQFSDNNTIEMSPCRKAEFGMFIYAYKSNK